MDKRLLVLRASEDIPEQEVNNIITQVSMYGVISDVYDIKSYVDLKNALNNGNKYDYVYLATHGCDTNFGNISGSLNISWFQFGALICATECNKSGSIFLHSCCRGGLNQVAYKMFNCCNNIDFICGPRNNISPVDLIMAFNLFLYYKEFKHLDPVVCAEKVKNSIDIRLVCYDRLDVESEYTYIAHCDLYSDDVNKAFEELPTEIGTPIVEETPEP
ncbi:hypothetical protein [Chryseobacterium sp.]|uniref:hypothetical protein n=1 Tax=Chryseobacterium sp. TaxID=1871047 RepID=UPI003342B940